MSTPTVLVIDDDPHVHALLRRGLRDQALALDTALSAREGIGKARLSRPDLILLDANLGAESGFDLCVELKRSPETATSAIIFLTANRSTAAKVRALDLGAVDYVVKPFETVELTARVRVALRTKRDLDTLIAAARVDPITGAWNRRYFDERLAVALAAARQTGSDLALVMLDLDHFKHINDRYGHDTGDRILANAAHALRATLRHLDVLCRYGGEEFVVILIDADEHGARAVAERLRLELHRIAVPHSTGEATVTASFGVAATRGADNLSAAALLAAADGAVYEAKRLGRDRVCVAEAVRGGTALRPSP